MLRLFGCLGMFDLLVLSTWLMIGVWVICARLMWVGGVLVWVLVVFAGLLVACGGLGLVCLMQYTFCLDSVCRVGFCAW